MIPYAIAFLCALLAYLYAVERTPKKWADTEAEYTSRQTLTIAVWRAEATDTAVSVPEKVLGTGLYSVKFKHINPGGSGGFMTALTQLNDLKPGDPLLIKAITAVNSRQSADTLLYAERLPAKK